MPMWADFAVGVASVVEYLVFGAWGIRTILDDKVFNTVVALGRNFPFPTEREVAVFIFCDDLAAGDSSDLPEDTSFDLPAWTWIRVGTELSEVTKVFAVE